MHLLVDILIIFSVSVLVVLLTSKIRIPSIIGFLFAGVAMGPNSLGLIGDIHQVEILAEVGAIFLLFTIGIEFSFKRLYEIRKSVLLGGSVQMALTIAAGLGLALLYGKPLRESVFLGMLLAMSSTAIVLKLLQERAEIESPHGLTSVGILIFQDMMIIPMILIVPLLSASGGGGDTSILMVLAKIAGMLGVVFIGARWVVPFAMYQIARTRIRELFLISIFVICFGVAWLSSLAGLSLALGAFFAGLIISESDYSHEALGAMLPFRDVFLSFFFISVGMLLDVRFFAAHIHWVLTLSLIVILLKTFAASLAALVLRYPLRTALAVGLALCQVGEFAFLLSKAGTEHNVLNDDTYQMFLAVAVTTMAVSPFLLSLSGKLAPLLADLSDQGKRPDSGQTLADHLVIIGFGLNGKNLSQAAMASGIPFIIIEMNPGTVRREQARGLPIFFGDASNEAVLEHAHVHQARVAVVAIQDIMATQLIVSRLRRANPGLCIIARTRFQTEVPTLRQLGADEVIPEEFETSIEIFSRVLRKYLVPRDEIEKTVGEIRAEGYAMLRSLSTPVQKISELHPALENLDIAVYRVMAGAPASGQTLATLAFRQKYKSSILAIKREEQFIPNPDGTVTLSEGDTVIMLHPPRGVADLCDIFSAPRS